MKKISSKVESTHVRNIMAIVINVILFLLDPPGSLGEWALKTVELFLFLIIPYFVNFQKSDIISNSLFRSLSRS